MPILAAAAVLALIGLAAGVIWRPITIIDTGETKQIRAAVRTVGQALYAAGVQVDTEDQVAPGLSEWVPWDGEIRVQRTAQVIVWEDGQARSLVSAETSPIRALVQAGITLNAGDLLLRDGQPLEESDHLPLDQPVVLQLVRAKTFQVASEGQTSEARSHGASVARAFWDAGIRPGPGDRLSPDPSSALVQGMMLTYQAARPLTIQVGSTQARAHSAAETVGQALAEAGVALQGQDYSLPAEDQPLPEDGQIRVVRVREEIVLKETLIPYESQSAPDPELELGQRRVLAAGQYGVQVTRERVRYEDGEEVQRGVDSDWTASEPAAETIGVGTKIVTKTADTPDGQIEYWREMRVYATSYSPCRLGLGDGRCNDKTASGQTLTKGIIAVTRPWYRQMVGSRVYIPGYGFGVIGDVGGGIPGTPWIDLGFGEDDYQGIIGWVTMYVLTPIPPNAPWSLP